MQIKGSATKWLIFYLPGRIRIKIPGIKGQPLRAKLMERFVRRIKGIKGIKVNYRTGRALIFFNSKEISLEEVELVLLKARKYSYRFAENQQQKTIAEEVSLEQAYYTKIRSFLLTSAAIMLVLIKRISRGKSSWADSLLLLSLSSVCTILAGYPLFRKGLDKATQEGKIMNYPLILGSAGLALGLMRESLPGLLVIWFSYLNDLLQNKTLLNCRRQIAEMTEDYEVSSRVLIDGAEIPKRPAEILPGMTLSLRHGEVIPVDGKVVQGSGLVYEGMLSGDSKLILKEQGDKAYAGTIVEDGHVLVKAEFLGSGTTLAGLNRFNQPLNHEIERQIDKSGRSLANVALLLAVLSLITRKNRGLSLAVLLMGNPGNLHLARSAPLSKALRKISKQGILVKSANLLEKSAEIDKICFDKTGTLTHVTAKDMDVVALDKVFSKADVLALVAGIEKNLSHPLAKILVKKAKQEKIPVRSLKGEVVPGYGVQGYLHGQKIILGSKEFLAAEGLAVEERAELLATRFRHQDLGVLFVAYGNKIIGLVGIKEVLNPGVKASIERLRNSGIKDLALLTGDREEPALVIGTELGISEIYTKTGPEDKVRLIQEFQTQGHRVAMVGDGANDSGALIQADLSFALNGRKNPGGVAAAGVVLPDNDLTKIPDFIELNKHTRLITDQNMFLVKSLNSLGLALAAGNRLTPFKASLLQNLGTIGLFLNSSRIGRRKTKAKQLSSGEIKRALKEVSAAVQLGDYPGRDWYNIPKNKVLQLLHSHNEKGLTPGVSAKLREVYGLNIIERTRRTPWWRFFLKQFDDFMVKLLLGTALISLFFGRKANVAATLAILVVNTMVGVLQEIKAEKDTESLSKLTSATARVIRDGISLKISVEQLVPGDIILLEAGDKAPADARLLDADSLLADESILTGENSSVFKDTNPILHKQPLAERKNMIYAGTLILKGKGKAVVTATGFKTEVGKIALQMAGVKEQEIPIKRRMDELGKMVAQVCILIAALIAAGGVLRGRNLLDMFMTAVTLLVAAIPEGLSVIVIIAMALGVQRMVKKNVVVRKLPALETLGATTVVCCDKTGTLTKNQLAAEVIYTSGRWYPRFSPSGFEKNPEVERVLTLGLLCNSIDPAETGSTKIWGDPTDAAIISAGSASGLFKKELIKEFPAIKEVPFDSESKMMSLYCDDNGQEVCVVKGAPETILAKCRYFCQDGRIEAWGEQARSKVLKAAAVMGNKALRVIAVAYCYNTTGNQNEDNKLIFAGMIGLRDQIRPEAKNAVARCHSAGVKVVMITGDHPYTAVTMARELGIYREGNLMLTGEKVDSLNDADLAELIGEVTVFARTAPVQKLRIVKALQNAGHIVAMTGDGVNDAPAIKAADIGIAMGQGGTDVARDAASLVLLDDNFATIVSSMEEGRNIFFNIKKSVRYLVGTNAGEVILMAAATLLGQPLPLTPIQLLWLNFLGDGLPAIALVSQEPGRGLMKQPPRDPRESIFAKGLGRKILRRGMLMGLGALGAYWRGNLRGGLAKARTLGMSSLILSQFWHLFDTHKGIEQGVQQNNKNNLLLFAGLSSLGIYLCSIYLSPFNSIFQLVPLNVLEWLFLFGISAAVAVLDHSVI
ncbi:MAG: HAD-IC family P-type ATPase [Peptococcaceae bacterium]